MEKPKAPKKHKRKRRKSRSVFKGNQWPEDTTNTSNFSDKWQIRAWTKTPQKGHHAIQLFADTGASISACDADYAKKKYNKFLHTRKSKLPVRVASGDIIHLKDYIYLPIYNQSGKMIFHHEFYLIDGLKHEFLASFYLLKKFEIPFPSDAPLLVKDSKLQLTPHHHPEEYDEDFGNCNNWDSPSITAREIQNDYSTDPHYQPYDTINSTAIDPIKMDYEVLHHLTKFDFTKYKPQSLLTDPYNNKIKSYNPQRCNSTSKRQNPFVLVKTCFNPLRGFMEWYTCQIRV